MSILIINCNHWIGFHLVNAMLEKDYDTYGMVDSTIKNDLTMFFGRNSDFSFVERDSKKEYDTCIVVGHYRDVNSVQADKIIMIQSHEEIEDRDYKDTTIVRVPILFGKWMPMNEKGVFKNNRLIPFESEEFIDNAIPIDIFTTMVLQWIQSQKLPKYIELYPRHIRENEKLENSVYIRDNIPMKEQIEVVRKHYKKYRNFYQ